VPAAPHQRNHRLAAEEAAGQVDVEHPPPFRLGERRGSAPGDGAGDIHQDIEPPKAFLGACDERVDLRLVGHVERGGDHLAT
jgi:hypothetical protein